MDLVSAALAGARIGEAGARWFGGSANWAARFEAFTGIGFHAVVGGSAWLIGNTGEPVRLSAGDIVLIPSGAEHALSLERRELRGIALMPFQAQPSLDDMFDLECICGAYRLGGGRVHQFLRDLPELIVVPSGRHPQLAALIQVLGRDISENEAGASVSRTALIDLVLVHALRAWQEHEGASFEVGDAQVGIALRVMHESLDAPWTVEQLSAKVGLSRTAFGRRFVAQVGTSPMAYLTSQRLIRAAQLLCDTDFPLAAIGGQVGYSSEFAFANAFRREFGLAPGRYRRGRQEALGLAL